MSGGAGSEADPYVFVEVGPDSLTVNSISTTVVVSEEVDEDMDFVNLRQGEWVFFFFFLFSYLSVLPLKMMGFLFCFGLHSCSCSHVLPPSFLPSICSSSVWECVCCLAVVLGLHLVAVLLSNTWIFTF